MHIENIVRKTLEIKDHRIVSANWEGNLQVRLEVKRRRHLPCSRCGHRAPRYDRLKERIWQHVPLWGIPVFLLYRPARVRCPHCGIKREALPWAVGKSTYTTAMVNVLATMSRLLSVEQVASMFGVHWNTVYGAIRAAVAYGLAHRRKGGVLHIGVDEISRKKGHRYLTQVYDLDRRILLYSGPDRTEESLEAFFDAYGTEHLQEVTMVCCDMWKPYVNVIKRRLPHATIVYDKFHLVRHLLDAVDTVRKQEARELLDQTLLKKTKYIFLKNPENLTEKQDLRLTELLEWNLKSVRAYLLKESFRELWSCRSRQAAERFLRQWCWMATHSRLTPLRDFAYMVRRHIDGILAWFEERVSNGIAEALNNSAKAISHRARGFRSPDTFITMQYLCLGGLDLPQTTHKFL